MDEFDFSRKIGAPNFEMPENFTITVQRYEKWWKRVLLYLVGKVGYDVVTYENCKITNMHLVSGYTIIEYEQEKNGISGSITYSTGGSSANERIQQEREKDTG